MDAVVSTFTQTFDVGAVDTKGELRLLRHTRRFVWYTVETQRVFKRQTQDKQFYYTSVIDNLIVVKRRIRFVLYFMIGESVPGTPKMIPLLVRPGFSSLVNLGHLQIWRTLRAWDLGNRFFSREMWRHGHKLKPWMY